MADKQYIDSSSQPKVKITAKDFASKMRDKQEVYHFLTHEVGAYLSSYDTMTVWHMRDLVSGKRHRIKGSDVKHLNVPQYEGLKIEEFYKFAGTWPKVMDAFPTEENEREKLPRQYVVNVIYTLVGQPFRTWVDRLVDKRHHEIAEKRKLYIELDPEVAAIFNKSQAVSTSQGSSFNLMKASAKRRRSKKQIEEEKLQEELHQREVERKMQAFDEMQQKMNSLQGDVGQVKEAQDFLAQLKENGLLYAGADGNIVASESLEQVQQLKRQRLDDSQTSEQIQRQLAQQNDQGPDEERRKVGQQLEPN